MPPSLPAWKVGVNGSLSGRTRGSPRPRNLPRVTQLAGARACPQTRVPDCRTRRLPWPAGDSQAGSLSGMPTSRVCPRMPVTTRSCPLACPKGESGFASVFPFLGTIWRWWFWEPRACLYLSCRFSELSGPLVRLTPPLSTLLNEAPGLCVVRWPSVDDAQRVSEGWEGGGLGYPSSRCPPGPEWEGVRLQAEVIEALTLGQPRVKPLGDALKSPNRQDCFAGSNILKTVLSALCQSQTLPSYREPVV